jgi:hypothetical protein
VASYTLTYSAGLNGTITGTTPQTVTSGADGSTVTAVPNSGYQFVQWSDASTQNPRTDLAVSANISVTASFAVIVATWPVTCIDGNPFPQLPFVGLSGTQQPNTVVFIPDAGPPMVRRRSTKSRTFLTTPLEMNGNQAQTFWAWFDNTLLSGTLPFTWNDFFTGASVTLRFACDEKSVKVPKFELTIGSADPFVRKYRATLELEYA